jgi:hypothetical protein
MMWASAQGDIGVTVGTDNTTEGTIAAITSKVSIMDERCRRMEGSIHPQFATLGIPNRSQETALA